MGCAALPFDEAGRLDALRALGVLDTGPEPEFDAIVRLASIICDTPISMVSLIDSARQFFKARLGVDNSETPRESSFCAHAILEPENMFIVPDATQDARFFDNPFVTGDPQIRFYAGAPLVLSGGATVGTLCTIDRKPRELSAMQQEALRVAARTVVMLLEKRSAEARLRMLELVAVHASDGVAIIAHDSTAVGGRRIDYVNRAFTTLTGYDEAELAESDFGRALLQLTRDTLGAPDGSAGRQRETLVDASISKRKDSAQADVEISLSEVVGGAPGSPRHVVAVVRDVTERRRGELERARAETATAANSALEREIQERRRAELQLSHAASHDALTGLPNRMCFKKSLEEAISDYHSHVGTRCAVVFIDLDRFKKVNDSLGHMMGDALLVSVAERLRSVLRSADIVSRFAGDEYTVLLHDVRDQSEAGVVVDRLAGAFCEAFRLGSSDVFVTASIGVTMLEASYASAEAVLRDADIAMFAAKENGRGRARFFSKELNARFTAATDLETSLASALQKSEFRLAYQPIVSLTSPHNEIQSFEALIRWHSRRGEMPPATFIPAAEEMGLIVPLGDWALNEACDRLAVWHASFAGRGGPLPSVSVNVSPKQFMNAQFVDSVDRALARSGIDPAYLALELTETTLMEDVEKGRAALAALRARGCKIYLDDFGTGYCSFGYLRRFAVDRLKIDRSFVSGGDGLDKTEHLADPEIIQAIITLARSLHIETIAEGVETDEQRRALVDMGCDAAQGFLFSRPVEDPIILLERARFRSAALLTTA